MRFFRRVLATILITLSTVAQSATAADLYGIYPGLDSHFLPGLGIMPIGVVHSAGTIQNTFIEVLSIRSKVVTATAIYWPSDHHKDVPPDFMRRMSVAQAIKIHSMKQGNTNPSFAYIYSRSPDEIIQLNRANQSRGLPVIPIEPARLLGVCDYANCIAYMFNGPVSGGSQCVEVSYLEASSPLIEKAQNLKMEPVAVGRLFDQNFGQGAQDNQSLLDSTVSQDSFKMPTAMKDCISVRLVNKLLKADNYRNRVELNISYQIKHQKIFALLKDELIS